MALYIIHHTDGGLKVDCSSLIATFRNLFSFFRLARTQNERFQSLSLIYTVSEGGVSAHTHVLPLNISTFWCVMIHFGVIYHFVVTDILHQLTKTRPDKDQPKAQRRRHWLVRGMKRPRSRPEV